MQKEGRNVLNKQFDIKRSISAYNIVRNAKLRAGKAFLQNTAVLKFQTGKANQRKLQKGGKMWNLGGGQKISKLLDCQDNMLAKSR